MSNTLPNQRVSAKRKTEADWHIPTIDYIINKAIALNSKFKDELEVNLNASEGEIDESMFKYILEPYGLTDTNNILPSMKNVSLIAPIKRRYMGEYIRQFKNFQVYHKDVDAVLERNNAVAAKMEAVIMQKLANKTIEMGAAEGQPKQTPEDLDAFREEELNNWVDEKVIQSQHILSYLKELTDSDLEYTKAFNFWFSTEEAYTYRTIIGNDIYKKVIHPREYYRIPTDNIFVEDDDMGMRKYKITFNEINERFLDRDLLSKEDILYLRDLQESVKTDVYDTQMIYDRIVDLHKLRPTTSNYFATNNIHANEPHDLSKFQEAYHVVFKAECKIGYLRYIDELGNISETVVDETDKLNTDGGDIDIRWDWISRVYEADRFGPEKTGIYTPPRLVEPQRQDVNILSSCKLPYNGITGTFNNNKRNPIVKQLIPYEALYKIFYYHKERATSKYKPGLMLMPESLVRDTKELTTEQRMAFAKRDDMLYIDDSAGVNSLQAARFLSMPGTEKYIEVLTQIIQSIKADAMDVADMNQQRYGDINQSAGKGVTEQAISKASTGSILMFTLFNKMVERDFEADIDHCKVAWIEGKSGAYYDKELGKVIYLDIDGEDFYNRNIGIFVGNSAINDERLQQYRNFAFSAGQNGDFDIAADVIESESSAELHKLIKKAMDAKRQHEQEMSERQAQATEKAAADVLQNGREQREHEKESWDAKYKLAIDVAQIQAGNQVELKEMDSFTKLATNEAKIQADKELNVNSVEQS